MNYRYNGPLSGLNLPGDAGEVVLINGKEYTLPPDNEGVQRLVKLKYLTELPEPAKVASKGASNAS